MAVTMHRRMVVHGHREPPTARVESVHQPLLPPH
jgi:hypothetical protein